VDLVILVDDDSTVIVTMIDGWMMISDDRLIVTGWMIG
jgi:hypothetical protein